MLFHLRSFSCKRSLISFTRARSSAALVRSQLVAQLFHQLISTGKRSFFRVLWASFTANYSGLESELVELFAELILL
jgi:hypothetical protein